MISTKEESKPKPKVHQKWTINGNGTITINALDVFHMPVISTLVNEYYTSHKNNVEFSKLDPGEQVTSFLSSLMSYSNGAKTIAISKIFGNDTDEINVIGNAVAAADTCTSSSRGNMKKSDSLQSRYGEIANKG